VAALGLEFNLYVLRNPESRPRVAEHRRKIADNIARFIDQQVERFGVPPRLPSYELARIVLAASDGLQLAGYIDPDEGDLYESFLELLILAWAGEPPENAPRMPPPRKRARR
jgi:hypothetical protein